MDKSELDSLESIQRPGEIQIPPICWRCHGTSNRELLCLCECREVQRNIVIHVHCMEKMANTQNIINCPSCSANYLLQRQRKSVLKMLWKGCVRVFMIQCVIISHFMLGGLMIYWLLQDDVQNIHLSSIIMKIIAISVYLYFVYVTMHNIID